jgi:hypothetical protein
MTMFKGGRSMLVAGIVAVGLVGGSAATANAATRIAATEDAVIAAQNFDFGSDTLVGGAPDAPGTFRWLLEDGVPKPRLEGFIDIKNANGSCAYMQMQYKNSANSVIHTTNTQQKCVTSNALKSFPVDFGTYKNANIAKVTINLIKVTGIGTSTAGSQTINFGPYVDEDIQILGTGVDFGNATFQNGAPTGFGKVTWTFDRSPRARLSGVLHVKNFGTDCVRMQLEYKDVAGNVLGEEHGGTVCSVDNSHQGWTVDFGGNFDDPRTVSVDVNLQTLNALGDYQDAGTDSALFSQIYLTPVLV